MTELLYLPDNDNVTSFEATVEEATEDYIVLDQTHFYPEGGGQPADHGQLKWGGGFAAVSDVQKDGGDVRHYIEEVGGGLPESGETVSGHIDENRRQAHRRMHTAQHIVSRVVLDEYDAAVAGNQVHTDRSRIDFEPADFSPDDIARIQERSNEIIAQGRDVTKQELPRDEVEKRVEEDRSNLDLIPDHVDPLRVVEITGVDICPCGGTHVDSLNEIGCINITDHVSKGADVERIEFKLER